MTEPPAPVRRPPLPEPASARLAAIRSAGAWMPWAGLTLAVIWWGVVAGALVTTVDVSLIARQPPVAVACAALLAVLPGLMVLMAGFMARESRRSAAANALVLEASEALLAPSDSAAARADTLAHAMSKSAEEVDRAMGHAISAMKALAGEIGDERMRLESVSYAASDNARDLQTRLSEERVSLEALARELKAQTDAMTDAIPRQSQMMIEAAKLAGEEVARADDALESRLKTLDATNAELTQRLSALQSITDTAHEQSEALMFAISRVEEKIEQSGKTVDSAVRAGEMAAAAATTTGDALKSAVADALDGARRANKEITAASRLASEDAADAITRLHETALQASASIKSASMAARAETDLTERRLAQVSDAFKRLSNGAAGPVANGVHHDEDAIERSDPALEAAPTPEPPKATPAPQITHADLPAAPAREVDDDLFEAGAAAGEPPPAEPFPPVLRQRLDEDIFTQDPLADTPAPQAADEPVNARDIEVPPSEAGPDAAAPARDAAWTSILSDIDRADSGQMPREDTAEAVIRRLEGSGIALSSIFRPKEKKKVALAARKGEQPRRIAVIAAAGGDVERVSKRLRADHELSRLAQDFVAMEEPDAIAALDRTQKTGRNASPRLSAFLLLDAAIGEAGADARF